MGGDAGIFRSYTMMVMPANNSKAEVHYLAGRYPGKMGWLLGPAGWKTPRHWLPYSIDNGRFVCWSAGKEWDETGFLRLLDAAAESPYKPLWVVVPDVVGDRDGTLREWDVWAPRIAARGLTLAMACQDGMTPADVPDGVVCFLGGSTEWKRKSISVFCESLPRVHVGRINTYRWLWACHNCGAESCDGTGWFRGDKKQEAGLYRYLKESANGGQSQKRLFGSDPVRPLGEGVAADSERQHVGHRNGDEAQALAMDTRADD